MTEYVRQQSAILLRRLAFEVNRTSRNADPDTIHDLRVAIRRFSRCLRVFSQFFPGRSWKKARRRLGDLMEATGEVRDRDIALKLLKHAGAPPDAGGIAFLSRERGDASRRLVAELQAWKHDNFSRKWREELGL